MHPHNEQTPTTGHAQGGDDDSFVENENDYGDKEEHGKEQEQDKAAKPEEKASDEEEEQDKDRTAVKAK
jgi:hypothetical protein